MPDRFSRVDADFPSLQACVDKVHELLRGQRLLFRGESTDRYLTTTPMLTRVRDDRMLPPKCRDAIEACVHRLHADLQEFLGMEPGLAMGFLQHYEAPTDLLDLTSDIQVAAYFASGGEVGAAGLLAIVPADLGSRVELQDLTNHPSANRPRRQRAFTFATNRFVDIKTSEAAAELGIRWYRFTLQQSDRVAFRQRNDLLDAHSDEVAGVIQLLLDSYPKTNDWAAQWLADHVVAAPFVTRPVGQDHDGTIIVELVSAEAAGLAYNEEVERFNNHRIWSNAYRDTRGTGGLANARLTLR